MTGWANLLTAADDDGWRLLAGYLYHDAAEAFARDVSADERLRQLGQAASLLNDPPVTGGKIERAAAMLQNVLDKRTGDTTALYASYLLARIDHDYRETELGRAEAGYRAVIAAAPDHPLAQLAAAQLALVLLYQRPDLAVPARVAAAAELAPVAGGAHLREVASTYYRLLADAAMFYDLTDERVLGWLQQADALGTHDMVVAATVRLQIAEVARILGRREQALTYYRRFLDGVLPTDQRYQTATERMREVEAGRP